MSIEPTTSGRVILCRIDEFGRPVTEKVVDDYIFLCGRDRIDEEITERVSEVICNFIGRNRGPSREVNYYDMPEYQKHHAMYGDAVRLAEEESLAESQETEYISRLINE
jgi:hypothetical protein